MHRSTTVGRRVAHDDALRDAKDLVCLPESRRIEQMVRRLLKRREHQHAVLHLRNTETRDTQDLALRMPT